MDEMKSSRGGRECVVEADIYLHGRERRTLALLG